MVFGRGNLVLATRMDGAAPASIVTSLAKARSTRIELAFVAGGVPISGGTDVIIGGLGAGAARQNKIMRSRRPRSAPCARHA